jgi:type IV secretion system protein VirB6
MAGYFNYLSQEVTIKLDGLVSVYQAKLSGDVNALFTAAASLYVLWAGYAIMAGKMSSPVRELVWRCVGMMMIMMFADYSSGYLGLVSDAIEGVKGGLSGGETVWDSLDKIWEINQNLAMAVYAQDTSTFQLQGAMAAFMVCVGGAIMLAASGVTFLINEVTLRLILSTAPLFIFFLMWGFLRPMFNNWLQAIFANILTILFVGMVLDVALLFEGEMINKIAAQASDSNLLIMGTMALVSGLMSAALIVIAARLAKELAGSGVEGIVASAPSELNKFLGGDKKPRQPKQNPSPYSPPSTPNSGGAGDTPKMTVAEKNQERLKRYRGY